MKIGDTLSISSSPYELHENIESFKEDRVLLSSGRFLFNEDIDDEVISQVNFLSVKGMQLRIPPFTDNKLNLCGETSLPSKLEVKSKQNLIKQEKETKMTSTGLKAKQTAIQAIKDSNLSSAKLAAKLTLGKTANKSLAKVVKPKLPMMIRGYADHPLADVLIANLFSFAIKQKLPNNVKANYVAEAMLDAAMVSAADMLNIDEMVSDFIGGLKLPKGITLPDGADGDDNE